MEQSHMESASWSEGCRSFQEPDEVQCSWHEGVSFRRAGERSAGPDCVGYSRNVRSWVRILVE